MSCCAGSSATRSCPGVGAVVLDEVHERHLDADLALALLVDVRANLRPDLRLLAMSATVEAERTAASPRWADAPVVTAPGALHPVAEVWCPPPPGVRRPDGRGSTPRFLDHVAATVRRALAEQRRRRAGLPAGRRRDRRGGRAGSPGVGRRRRPLHGRLPAAEQDAALRPGDRRRVVLATAVAESSLTVPGVRVVVDAGLSRVPRTDHARGLGAWSPSGVAGPPPSSAPAGPAARARAASTAAGPRPSTTGWPRSPSRRSRPPT